MSTSYSPAPEARPDAEVQPFPYVELGVRIGPRGASPVAAVAGTGNTADSSETLEQREAAARETGRREGEAAARASSEVRLAEIRHRVGLAIDEFSRERAKYFEQVEGEVVQLALSIARKILHREAQIDPLLLAGMVRITMEKMENATQVVVRVHPQQVSEYRGYFAQLMESRSMPEVVEDAALEADQCVLQTALGTTQLGMGVQLKEIEQGLFDLLAKRPASV